MVLHPVIVKKNCVSCKNNEDKHENLLLSHCVHILFIKYCTDIIQLDFKSFIRIPTSIYLMSIVKNEKCYTSQIYTSTS